MKRGVYFAVFAFATMLISTNVHAQKGVPPAKMDGHDTITGKAAIACNYERDLWMGHKFDLIPTYILPTYTTHHSNDVDTVGSDAWKAWAEKQKTRPGDSCPGAGRTIIESENFVIFLSHSQTPDPKDPTRMINHTHCDIWRFEGNKIAEHWTT
jgi:predicted SnoaL-like aldol condensation-catalyzing enzyme